MSIRQLDSFRPHRFIIHILLDPQRTKSAHTVWVRRDEIQMVKDAIAEMRSDISESIDKMICELALRPDVANLDALKYAVGVLCATSVWNKNELQDRSKASNRPRDKFRHALDSIIEVGPLYRNELGQDIETATLDLIRQAQHVRGMLAPSLPRQMSLWHSSCLILKEKLIIVDKSLTVYETSAKCSDGMTMLKDLLQLSGLGSHDGSAITKAVKDSPIGIDQFVDASIEARYVRVV